ncbi:Growth_factor receptor cysteine-rich domain superfamily [Hexamita inflata]|uniref:Growth_factor receptor cysteine-rich domain superfamily n=1 Tax=Hexamita inflata TaxID=28002 RepID=A0ABP1HYZ8_9EUKA
MQSSKVLLQIDYVNIFAIFASSSDSQLIYESTVNISIAFRIVQGSLICIYCDVYTQESTLVFVAAGQKLSGILLKFKKEVKIYNTSVQFRFDSLQSSGIVNEITEAGVFKIMNTNITGYVYSTSPNNGYIVSSSNVSVSVTVSQSIVCANIAQVTGSGAVSLTTSFVQSCLQVCKAEKYVYGLCLPSLVQGHQESSNNSILCADPFQYDGADCVCKLGYVLNVSVCIDIVKSLTTLDINLASNASFILDTLKNNVTNLEATIQQNFDLNNLYLKNNATSINSRITLLNDSLTQQLFDTNAKLTDVNNTLTQTTRQLRTDLTQTNVNVSTLIAQYNQDIGRINTTLIGHSSLISQLDQKLTQNTNELKTLTKTVSDNLNAFKDSSTTINNQQTAEIANQLSLIRQINASAMSVRADLTNVNNYLTGRINGQDYTISTKANTADVYAKGTSDWYINNIQGQINALNNRISGVTASTITSISSVIVKDCTPCNNCANHCGGCCVDRSAIRVCDNTGCKVV